MNKKLMVFNNERIAVLNGKGKIDDMIVFLLSRKLEKILSKSEAVQERQGK
ncbi:MAG: hypothetical protein PHO01_03290 [Desulfotomaculaceae bacterium]|nr:hypothetical protein [Desulfotomaculaceae bacterium]